MCIRDRPDSLTRSVEDLMQKPLTMHSWAEHNLFRKHRNLFRNISDLMWTHAESIVGPVKTQHTECIWNYSQFNLNWWLNLTSFNLLQTQPRTHAQFVQIHSKPFRNHPDKIQDSLHIHTGLIQISLQSPWDLIQFLCEPHSDHFEISLRPHSDLMRSSSRSHFKSHSNLVWISFRYHSDSIQESFTFSCKSFSDIIWCSFRSHSELTQILFRSHSHSRSTIQYHDILQYESVVWPRTAN